MNEVTPISSNEVAVVLVGGQPEFIEQAITKSEQAAAKANNVEATLAGVQASLPSRLLKATSVVNMATIGSAQADSVLLTHPLQGGLFYFSPVGTVDGGRVFAAQGGFWVRDESEPYHVRQWGAVADGTTINTTALQNAINAVPDGMTLYFGKGVYRTGKLTLNRSTITLQGEPGTVLAASGRYVLELGNMVGNTLQGIRFTSLESSTVTDYFGLVYSLNKGVNRLTIRNCEFTAPACATNGIKLVADTISSFVKDVTIENCRFESIGRMGIEIQGHLKDGVKRYSEIYIRNNTFKDLGLITSVDGHHYGMAVSLSGAAKNVAVENNLIDNPYDIAIELTAGTSTTGVPCTIDNGKVNGNRLQNITRQNSEASRPLSLISYDTGSAAQITNNICDEDAAVATVFFKNLTGAYIAHNTFYLTKYFQVTNCTYSSFYANTIKTGDIYGVLLENSGNNSFDNNRITCTATSGFIGVIRCDGAAAINNTFREGELSRVSGQYLSEINEAHNNKFVNVRTAGAVRQAPATVTLISNLQRIPEEAAQFGAVRLNGTATAGWIIYLPKTDRPTWVDNTTSVDLEIRCTGQTASAGFVVTAGSKALLATRLISTDIVKLN